MQILFISQQLKDDSKVLNGGSVCSKTLYDSFCYAVGKKNVKCIFIPEEKNIYKRYIDYLFLRNMYTKKQEKEMVNEINAVQYDLIVLDGSWFGKLLEHIANKKKIILFLHNIEKDYSIQRFKKNCLTIFRLRSVMHNEKAAVSYADYIFVLNNRDQDLLWKYYGRKADLLLPIVIKDKYLECKEVSENNNSGGFLLFVGSLFAPNVEGIRWFVTNVMPYIRKKLVIVGKNMEQINFPRAVNVKVLGTVNNLEELYIKAAAVVIPIFSGGGMKVKTAEALMYGKKVYATDEALNGYDVRDVSHIIRCNTADEFIEQINLSEDNRCFYPEVRKRFLEKYEQSSRNSSVKDFLSIEDFL